MPFGLLTAPSTFTTITRPYHFIVEGWEVLCFSFLKMPLILADSCMQGRIDGQMGRMGCILSLNKNHFKFTQVFSYMDLSFDTRKMIISLFLDKYKL